MGDRPLQESVNSTTSQFQQEVRGKERGNSPKSRGMKTFDATVFLVAMGIILLEMSEAATDGLAIYAETGYKAFIFVSLGAGVVLIAAFLVGQAIAYLPIVIIRLIAAFLLLYFGLRLARSAKRAVLRARLNEVHKEEKLEKELSYTAFSRGGVGSVRSCHSSSGINSHRSCIYPFWIDRWADHRLCWNDITSFSGKTDKTGEHEDNGVKLVAFILNLLVRGVGDSCPRPAPYSAILDIRCRCLFLCAMKYPLRARLHCAYMHCKTLRLRIIIVHIIRAKKSQRSSMKMIKIKRKRIILRIYPWACVSGSSPCRYTGLPSVGLNGTWV